MTSSSSANLNSHIGADHSIKKQHPTVPSTDIYQHSLSSDLPSAKPVSSSWSPRTHNFESTASALPGPVPSQSLQDSFKMHNPNIHPQQHQQYHHYLKHDYQQYPSRSHPSSFFNYSQSSTNESSPNIIFTPFSSSSGPSFEPTPNMITSCVFPTAIPTPNYSPVLGPNTGTTSFAPEISIPTQEPISSGLPSPPLTFRVGRLKPPMPYPMLLSTCILHAPNQRLTLRQIYEVLMQRYPDTYRPCERFRGWQNTVRYNLSRCGVFEKIARRTSNGLLISSPAGISEPTTKGSWWTIKPEWLAKISSIGMDALKNLGDDRASESNSCISDGTAPRQTTRKSGSKRKSSSRLSASSTSTSPKSTAGKACIAKSNSKKSPLSKSSALSSSVSSHGPPPLRSQHALYRGPYFPSPVGYAEPTASLPSLRLVPNPSNVFFSNNGGGACNNDSGALQYHGGYQSVKDQSSRYSANQLPLPQPLPDWAAMNMFSPSPPYLHHHQQPQHQQQGCQQSPHTTSLQSLAACGYTNSSNNNSNPCAHHSSHSTSVYPNHHHQPPPSQIFPTSNSPVYRY